MHWICVACGLEYGGLAGATDASGPPARCAICSDERQYVPPSGQAWTTSEEQEAGGTLATLTELEPGLHEMRVQPTIGIGHRPMLVRTGSGNLLWEPPGFISPAAIRSVRELGGITAIAGSHPHLMGAMTSWSRAFDNAPIFFNAADKDWIVHPDPAITHWSGEANPLPGIRLVQCGGHFPGSCVLLWGAGAAGRGVILTGDTIFIGPDNKTISVMRSFPNRLPLPEGTVNQILDRLEPLDYDRMYGSFGQLVPSGARAIVRISLGRYIAWIRGDVDDW
ncbi:hydrolase [Glaciibacter sp. 2TAF33]|uniref:hydrolase n=1 Tax=Glaciibacter sp. 2TAF33 TaxID=3233015 RepID=UPI003F8EC725